MASAALTSLIVVTAASPSPPPGIGASGPRLSATTGTGPGLSGTASAVASSRTAGAAVGR